MFFRLLLFSRFLGLEVASAIISLPKL